MPWHNVAVYFLGGMFLANFFPHFIAGMSGVRFYTPFATPPFRGLSSPIVNILYALFNLAMAYVLLVAIGGLELQRVPHVAVSAAGFGLASIFIARSVTKLRSSSQSLPAASRPGDGAGGVASV
jgi:hypothetical protein